MSTDALSHDPVVCDGLDGANPLGFLAALGAFALLTEQGMPVAMAWQSTASGWRPVLAGTGLAPSGLVDALYDAMQTASMEAFDVNNKLPFGAAEFKTAMGNHAAAAAPARRRTIDFLTAFGSEIHVEKNGDFQGTRLRMVRSGDSAGQGLPVYAKVMRSKLTAAQLQRTVFEPWDYQDEAFSLRWDPLEDQRYALRWRDPSKSDLRDGPGTMQGANCLAIEALRLFPVQPAEHRAETTGFRRNAQRQVHFSWPLWETPIALDVCIALLAQADWQSSQFDTQRLQALGVGAVYHSQRIQQNQYYSNFAPARPVA